jgi:DNA mismatch endonuclease (patch repair protein)
MKAQVTRDTAPELALRRELHRRGLRYRVNHRPEPDLRVTADVVFTRRKVAVFVDGCFWHRCPEHATAPHANATWWAEKLQRTVDRDRAADTALSQRGWTVIRIWEHTKPPGGADTVEHALTAADRAV